MKKSSPPLKTTPRCMSTKTSPLLHQPNVIINSTGHLDKT